MTSAVCKSLYENNRELKTRHQALLARLPPSPTSSSPAGSSAPSPMSPDSQLPQSPHYYSADDSHASSNASVLIPRPRPHYRRVSVSPADLALLSDQNAELLAKLEKLEAESIQADQAGRRKLRNLEKEIQGLRDELDKTRERSDELEKKARVFSESAALRDEEVERRRREREERLRALRSKADSGDQETEIRDFAPGGALSSKNRFTPRRRHISEAVARPHRIDEGALDERPRRVSLQTGLSRSASLSHHSRFPPSNQSPVTLTHEYALVSQLLLKIQELEETNTQITEQQARTVAQLQTVQKDATSLRLVYESLGDVEGVEWIAEESDGSPSSGDDEANETIRFASLRRTLSVEASIDFAGGIAVGMQSSLKHPVFPDHVPVAVHPKVRRSVVGLFDSPQEEVRSPSSPVSETATSVLDMMIPGLPPVPFVPQPSNTSSTAPSSRSPSPILSQSLAGTVSPPIEDALGHPTLDSELGAAFDGNWDGRIGHDGSPDNLHFRTSSIVSLTSIIPGAEGASSAVSISGVHTRPEPERFADVFAPEMSLSRSSAALQPGSWQGGAHRSISSDLDSKPASPAERQRRKSQTIRMRAAHWKEGRFGGTLLPADKRSSLDMTRPSTPVPERLANAFEAIVDTMSRSKGETSLSLDWRDEKGRSEQNSVAGMRSGGEVATASPPAPRQRGIVAFVLEIWLWLQFAIIVVVFVWAMARRGPKSVLEEAGRRKTGSLKG